jgi:hypothetical protein
MRFKPMWMGPGETEGEETGAAADAGDEINLLAPGA